MERSPSPEPSGPRPIRRLQESLINRIAAGEIIHRPASALKELIENSLDAGSTSIKVLIKDGGLKLLQIQDNGCGIRKSDLPILAERFTTSKLSTFEDLSSLQTYGFRGEALASISYVSKLSVVTKTKTSSVAFKAHYSDGELCAPGPGQSADPKACAGNDGTTVTAKNLFYNTPQRLAALRSSSEEYSRILDVVTKYATHNPRVSFTCKKHGSASPDISTPSNSTTKEAIRLLYGQSIARELINISVSSSTPTDSGINDDDVLEGEGVWKAEAEFTNANYQAKKTVFLLFINHRLVESVRIKRALESVFSIILPKGAYPFIYLSLEIDPRAVDVNVHPTKREVHFLNEEAVTSRIADEIQSALAGQGRSRVYEYQNQTLLTGGVLDPNQNKKGKAKANSQDDDNDERGSNLSDTQSGVGAKQKTVYSKDKVRVSQLDRTLDSMFPILDLGTSKNILGQHETEKMQPIIDVDAQPSTNQMAKQRQLHQNVNIEESKCFLSSVKGLRDKVKETQHQFLTEIIQNHVFVGIVDLPRSLSLIQHETKLYLVNHASLAEELFYQLGLRQFGNYARIKLEPQPPIRHLIQLAVRTEEKRWKKCGLDLEEDEVVNRIVKKIMDRVDMIEEYFALSITKDGKLASIPKLLPGYIPDLNRLPLFLMRLGPQVNWDQESECFSSFLRELAYFYAPTPISNSQGSDSEKALRWQIEHSLFPTLKKYFRSPRTLLDRDVIQIASLPDLYKVFERC
ncbi:DNA mismatch repair [Pyrrhoderma noxium]|uniref:DNA mismatch repair n=1 Tax=Pyrrhoderma noxium TaxID=2282107 RepID=A0A286UHS1_9AGAM|nr:DNA mismatch repair [Pyrrhoderma noxium]